jgi:carbamoyltransferase
VQTVSRDTNANYYDLIAEFERQTGCAVLVNTSFNVRGEPIVCTPADAYQCFMRTHIDYLVLGPYLLDKTTQPPWEETAEWREQFQLD